MNVLVTDGNQRAALAVTRSLGRRGITVLVGEANTGSLASSSRYCRRHITYPSPYLDPEGFDRFLLNFLQQNGVEVVIPITDVTTNLISQRRVELEPYTQLCVPDFEAFNLVSDKLWLLQHSEELGIPIPRTYFLEDSQGLQKMQRELNYPVVVKPSRSRMRTDNGWVVGQVHYVHSEAELYQLYYEKEYLQYPSLIQERIIGPGLGLFLLFDHGHLMAAFSHRRLRERPPSGGVSVFRESIPIDPSLVEHAIRLFTPLRWNGVAMMEYKLDLRTDTPLLIEVNGRFWGSLQLAIDAGMDFPYLLYRMATEGKIEAQPAYQAGVKSRWLLGDLDHLLLRLFKSDRDLHLPPGFPSRARTLLQFLQLYSPGVRYEILSLKDPRPFLYELSCYLRDLLQGNHAAITA
jgi:predicted ATP-grasp superfamily ATP-dependent carboligase